MAVGGPVKLIAIPSRKQWALSARIWWPATTQAWQADAPDSFWPTLELGLIKNQYTASPKVGVALVNAENSASGQTELFSRRPDFAAPANQVSACLRSSQEQPPPPPLPDDSWGAFTSAWRKRPAAWGERVGPRRRWPCGGQSLDRQKKFIAQETGSWAFILPQHIPSRKRVVLFARLPRGCALLVMVNPRGDCEA